MSLGTKWIASLAVMALISGCATSYTTSCTTSYTARPEATTALAGFVVAARESDGALRLVRADTVAEIGHTSDGRVRLGGRRRHPREWSSGIALTAVGAVLSIISVGLAGSLFSNHCNWVDGPCPSNSATLIITSLVLAPVGGALGGIVGPALMIAGSRQRPVDQPAWMPSLPARVQPDDAP
jgi:hypothetical protein